ncbi:hypothetical protein TSUD_188670 [Trifolium subterraneum]|uniref:TF-B3 domain-containing protein n=1 Tax=Trifolium subterraneum TaxID=3900 RepID=A0A2Z6NLY1_TRISU|nr:hypothetical protein TSUD_188670 [Trifolium subterraneum]
MAFSDHYFMNNISFLDNGVARQIDHEEDTCMHDILAKIQTYQIEFDVDIPIVAKIWTYQMEFHVDTPIGKSPKCFAREFGDVFDPYIIIRDPNDNEIEIHVVKKNNKLYFKEGWWGGQVKYPTDKPPIKRLVSRDVIGGGNGSYHLSITSSILARPRLFVRSYVKKVTSYDVESRTLILPWYGFGELVFEFAYADLLLIDYVGVSYTCSLRFESDSTGELSCKLSSGWGDFCKAHQLAEGEKVRFGVLGLANNNVLHVCVYPQIGIEKTLNCPLNDGTQMPLFVSHHYFAKLG